MNTISNNTLKRAAGVVLALLCVATIVGLYIFNNPSYPKFSHDSATIEGWWSSKNENLQKVARSAGNNYRGDPIDTLPVADLTIHHGDRTGQSNPKDACFVAFSYYDYPLAGLDAAYVEYEDRKKAQGELKELDPSEHTITTFEGDETYELRQYDYTIEGEDVLSGYQVGFVEMQSGHIRIEGVCKTAEDLQLTQPILETVTLNER